MKLITCLTRDNTEAISLDLNSKLLAHCYCILFKKAFVPWRYISILKRGFVLLRKFLPLNNCI